MTKKIYLVTTFVDSPVYNLMEKAAVKLGYEFTIINLSELSVFFDGQRFGNDELNKIENGIVIVRGIFNNVRPISLMISKLRKRGIKVFDNNFLEHQYSIDKLTDLLKLSYVGVPIPKSAYSRNFEDYSALAEKLSYPLIIKLTRSGMGENVYKVENTSELEELTKTLKKRGRNARDFLLQEFIPYVYDLRCLIIGGSVTTMRRIPPAGDFRANFSLGGSVEPFDLDRQGQDLARKALSAVGMSVGGVDILITKDNKRYILEVNHNASFVGMQKATGADIATIYLKHAIENAY